MIDYINEIKENEIKFDKDFSIYIYCGYGMKTGKDIFIHGIVNDYRDIKNMTSDI